jgi:hypothetical protein
MIDGGSLDKVGRLSEKENYTEEMMPKVGGKWFPYGAAGKKAAEEHGKKTGKKVTKKKTTKKKTAKKKKRKKK